MPATFSAGDRVAAFLGLDGGSTSTKGVLLSTDGDVLCKAYQLSKGNPIQDTIDIVEELRGQVESQGATLDELSPKTKRGYVIFGVHQPTNTVSRESTKCRRSRSSSASIASM